VDVLKKQALVGTARKAQEKFVDVLKKQALVGTARKSLSAIYTKLLGINCDVAHY
jgi:predicted RNA binding protein with dsRBD fold (UPF0201 family)